MLVLTACAQVVLLVAMIVRHALPLMVGEPVLLRVMPVDPRDFFRGDYVILSYDVNRLPIEGRARRGPFGMLDSSDEGRAVYVKLEPEEDGRHWRGTEAGFSKPAGGKYLRGSIKNGSPKFGIEAYYVQEGTGRELERLRNNRRLSAEVSVAPWGQAALRRVIEE